MSHSQTLQRAAGTAASRVGVLGRIGQVCYRHRLLTVFAWMILVAVLITLWLNFGAAADDSFGGTDPGQAVLNAHLHRQSGDTLTLAISSQAPIDSPAVKARITSALVPFSRAAGVTSVTSPYKVPGQISHRGGNRGVVPPGH